MGRLILLIYLDTTPLIYLVEQVPQLADIVADRLSSTDTIVISEFTRLECRVKPLRERATEVLNDFDRFFSESVGEILSLSREVMDSATDIRARYGFKTPDAIHLAAASVAGCDLFLTNDLRLDRFVELPIEVLQVR
ncbi:MAG: type II toxin-antitoxin system VapC family toxin [bacterium]|nr:type II toxin-antitoxin system VapC family toxin [bacterium]